MDGWMDGWMDGRMDGWMDGWMNEGSQGGEGGITAARALGFQAVLGLPETLACLPAWGLYGVNCGDVGVPCAQSCAHRRGAFRACKRRSSRSRCVPAADMPSQTGSLP
eukprot:227090-Chlamydomonas_euryale.AAC.1